MNKTVFYDMETTGIDPETAAVVQIGAILDIDGEEVDNLNLKIRPFEGAYLDPAALAVTGLSVDDLMNDPARLDPREAYWKFLEFCGFRPGRRVETSDRIHRAGYNIMGFDNRFLDKLGVRSGDKWCFAKFHWPGIDVASIACAALRQKRGRMKDFKLMSVARAFDIDTDGQAHDALFDVRVTRDLYYEIIARGL